MVSLLALGSSKIFLTVWPQRCCGGALLCRQQAFAMPHTNREERAEQYRGSNGSTFAARGRGPGRGPVRGRGGRGPSYGPGRGFSPGNRQQQGAQQPQKGKNTSVKNKIRGFTRMLGREVRTLAFTRPVLWLSNRSSHMLSGVVICCCRACQRIRKQSCELR
jgi:hypothetical protein